MSTLKGFNIGGGAPGPVFTGEQDDACSHVNEDGQKCIRPRGHTEGMHFYPKTEENDGN